MRDKITVVTVDGHELFRKGVAHTLRAERDIDIVGEGATADDAMRLACDLLPDLILLDIAIPGGIHAAQTIAAACPVVKIVMLTGSDEEDDVIAALRAGARGYILKGVLARELVRILRAIYAGEGYVPPALAASLLSDIAGASSGERSRESPLDELTEREHQILERVAVGFSNKEIGQQLHLSEKTVKHHMTNILQKLQVRNRVEAALLARQGSWADPKTSRPAG